MKRSFLYLCLGMLSLQQVNAQSEPSNSAKFELGSGLNLSYDKGNYTFRLGGMIQPFIAVNKTAGQETDYGLYVKRTYFNLAGKAVNEKVDFFLQLDFSLTSPLLDAWVNYQPVKGLNISAGQKLNPANNREMTMMETGLQFPDRSILSEMYSQKGRDFGLFLSYQFTLGNIGFKPQVSATSGDGRNSFGADSRDVDQGGFKYGFRFDLYPLGFFKEGNEQQFSDLAFEEKPRLVIGAAGSYNDGASDPVGEGHNTIELYNGIGQLQFPDYRKISFDMLLKFKGLSVMGEYTRATGTNVVGLFTSNTGTSPLTPTVISQYLSLGDAYAIHAGYVLKKGYGIDVRYASVAPEFETNTSSIVQNADKLDIGLSRYFMKNALKLQASYSTGKLMNIQSNQVGILAQLWF